MRCLTILDKKIKKKKSNGGIFMNNVLKFLLLAAGCIIVVVLISLGFNLANKGKADVDTNVEKYNNLSAKYDDVEITIYDGMTVLGSEVKQLIKNYENDDYLSIVVKTSMASSPIPYVNTPESDEIKSKPTGSPKTYHEMQAVTKRENDYINDRGNFLGKVYYDENNVASCIWFEQQ